MCSYYEYVAEGPMWSDLDTSQLHITLHSNKLCLLQQHYNTYSVTIFYVPCHVTFWEAQYTNGACIQNFTIRWVGWAISSRNLPCQSGSFLLMLLRFHRTDFSNFSSDTNFLLGLAFCHCSLSQMGGEWRGLHIVYKLSINLVYKCGTIAHNYSWCLIVRRPSLENKFEFFSRSQCGSISGMLEGQGRIWYLGY